jgi:hypothetical protein
VYNIGDLAAMFQHTNHCGGLNDTRKINGILIFLREQTLFFVRLVEYKIRHTGVFNIFTVIIRECGSQT